MSSVDVVACVLLVVFSSSVILTRRLVIAPRVRGHTKSEINGLRDRIPDPSAIHPAERRVAAEEAHWLLDDAEDVLVHDRGWWPPLKSALFWTGSRDIVAFELIHKAKVKAIEVWSAQEVAARIRAAQAHLEELPKAQQRVWREQLPPLASSSDLKAQRAGLAAFKRELYEARDDHFAAINSLQNKATWLIGVSTLILIALSLDGYAELLMAGGVGGIVSRAHRVLGRGRAPTDYGLSWARVFIAPVVGALAAWAGLEVLMTLRDLNVIALPNLFKGADPLRDPTNGIIGLAIVFGFSERFLDRVADMAERGVTQKGRTPRLQLHSGKSD